MNAIDFLINEHDHVRHILMNISDNSLREESKKKLFDTLCLELIRHEEMEHEIWYPIFKNKIKENVQHLIAEEHHTEKAIEQFKAIKSQQEWEEKFTKFRRAVERHTREEEHDLFPEVKRLLSPTDLEEIGLKMFQYKKTHPLS